MTIEKIIQRLTELSASPSKTRLESFDIEAAEFLKGIENFVPEFNSVLSVIDTLIEEVNSSLLDFDTKYDDITKEDGINANIILKYEQIGTLSTSLLMSISKNVEAMNLNKEQTEQIKLDTESIFDQVEAKALEINSNLQAFRGFYHGASEAEPTNNVTQGDLWFDSVSESMKQFDGSFWNPFLSSVNGKALRVAKQNINVDLTIDEDETLLCGEELVLADDAVLEIAGGVSLETSLKKEAFNDGDSIQAGEYKIFAMENPKGRWLFCNGRKLDVFNPLYKELFEAIGFTYGGSGLFFHIPNRQGLSSRCIDYTNKVDSYKNRKIGSKDNDAFQGHYHKTPQEGGGYVARGENLGSFAGHGLSFPDSVTAFEPREMVGFGKPRISTETKVKNMADYICIRY